MCRRMGLLLICILILFNLTACFGAKEIDDRAYVLSLGLDQGVEDKLRFTIQFPTLKGGMGGGGSGSSGAQANNDYAVISVDAPSLLAASNIINTSLSRTINYTHVSYFVISEELAKKGVGMFINALLRNNQIRRTMHIIVTRGLASDFIKEINPVLGTAISKTQQGEMDMQNETGLFNDITFGEFIDDIKTTYEQATAVLASINDFSSFKQKGPSLPSNTFKAEGDYYAGELPRSGGNKTEYMGTAIFNGDKMVGMLNGEESRALLITKGEFRKGYFAFPDPLQEGLNVTMDVRQQKKPKIKITLRGEKPLIQLKVFLEGDLVALKSTVEYENPKMKPVMEDKFKEYIKQRLDQTINKCKNLNSDVFGFGKKAAMQFLTIQEWEAFDWPSKFKDAQVTTEVEFVIRRTGTMEKTSPTQKAGGGQK